MFWLEGKREIRRENLKRRLDDIRIACNWTNEGKRTSLRGFDLVGANLSGKDLSGADLESANLEGATFWATDLSNANLRGANFRKAKMKSPSFQKAVLRFADFSGATIMGADFSEADVRNAKFRQVKKLEGCMWKAAKVDETTELSAELEREIKGNLLSEEGTTQETTSKIIS
jgi:uncharacterized protein YjbI with pentapeptide repeats